MDITLLKTFIEVAQTGSFGTAAERLLVTQSAVSLRIAKLEASLGRALFTRSKAGAELTVAQRKLGHRIITCMVQNQRCCVDQQRHRRVGIKRLNSCDQRLGLEL